MRHYNSFLCPSPRRYCICLSHIVSDSDLCFSVSVSCSKSCPLTSTGFRSCGVPPAISICFSFACLTFFTVVKGRPCLCSRSDLGGLLRCQRRSTHQLWRCHPLPPLFTPWRCYRTRSDAVTCVLPSDAASVQQCRVTLTFRVSV